MDLKTIFANITGLDVYQRVDASHPLNIYVGVDEQAQWTMLLICDDRPANLVSSRMIHVKTGKRQDGRWTVSFSLIQHAYSDMFVLFCADVIDSSRVIQDKSAAIRFVVKRYFEWKEMLADAKTELLTTEEVKGLLGELFFLKNWMMPRYGPEKSIQSWTGPRAGHQDFVIDDFWYEVKTISRGRETVEISSLEQLDCEVEGMLVVIFAEATSLTNHHATNLNKLYGTLMSQLEDDVKIEFSNMLLRYGYYPRSEYEKAEYTFEIYGMNLYRVTSTFPCLRRKEIPGSVVKAEYSLYLSAIQLYKETDL